MKVIYKGKLIDVDGDKIDGKNIISEDNYNKYESKKIAKTWVDIEHRQKREFGIGNVKTIDDPSSVLWEDNYLV